MKTSELQGASLDYWVARAEGVPADQLEIRPVQRPDPRTPDTICVRRMPYHDPIIGPDEIRMQPSTSWAQGGPLWTKAGFDVVKCGDEWAAYDNDAVTRVFGDTPLIAICRAVVRAAFGDEVEDLPC